jgi:hypothetical protein
LLFGDWQRFWFTAPAQVKPALARVNNAYHGHLGRFVMAEKLSGETLSSHKGTPDESSVFWRMGFLSAMNWIMPSISADTPILLEEGNRKIGKHSKHYDALFVWNLPPVATCPGASKWCVSYCYNADSRKDVFPIDAWSRNWGAFLTRRNEVRSEIINKIQSINGKTAVRIHSSGDFFSSEYINFWIDIVKSLPNTDFWAYTRSWAVDNLLPDLERLHSLDNIELFASWDNHMIDPPKNWRRSIVITSKSDIQSGGIICPEQTGAVPNCANCRYCMIRGKGDVFFILY